MDDAGYTRPDGAETALRRHFLDAFFKPRSVAVVGASERPGTVGRKVFRNLLDSRFGGAVHAVNPARRQVFGLRALPRVSDIGFPVDLAVIVTPAPTVPAVLDDCIAAGVPAAVIISAGFTETGERGRALEGEIRSRVRSGGIRVIGPNSLGLMNPIVGLNAAYSSQTALRGSVGFISQSGAICASVLDWSFRVRTGFSVFASFGAMVDVGWGDLIYYLGDDPKTKSIVIYMEAVGDARSFLSAAREVALVKPIIVMKAGQTPEGARAARLSAYTSADTGDDAVLSAALMRCGVLRVDDVETLFSLADVLGKQPRPRGPRLAIVGNAAGPNILATDALVAEGGAPAVLSPDTLAALNGALPPYWNHANPVDVVADADSERYADAVAALARAPEADGVLVLLAPQAMTDPAGTAEALARLDRGHGKPLLASWMGGDAVAGGVRILNEHGIPAFPYPDTAARVFAAMWRYSYVLRALYETPQSLPAETEAGRALARGVIAEALAAGRVVLTETEARAVLAAYDFPVSPAPLARTADEAAAHARALGFPVTVQANAAAAVCGLWGPPPLRALVSEEEVRRAFDALAAGADGAAGVVVRPSVRDQGHELLLGGFIDPQFGPCVEFGAGGAHAHVLRDRGIGLTPLTTTLARRVIERSRTGRALRDVPGGVAVDLDRLEGLLVRLGDLMIEQPRIREITVNPLFAGADRIEAEDVRIVLHDAETPDAALPRPAIRPYPAQYTRAAALRDGTPVTLRPVRPEDEMLMVDFHRSLSSDTVYFRYLRLLSLDQRIQHERLSRLCFIDYDRQLGMAAVTGGEAPRILAISRLVKLHGAREADFAVVVSDSVQGLGLGEAMLRHLVDAARSEGIARITGVIHAENTPMQRLCRKVGFHLLKPAGDDVIATLDL
ncbi:MAG TPA: GNAT family N-acetyltransferase [Candidatus Hydrogenedentes bacterium]|nr:GNAT family N-acetyltransferase [Candidatus Hydrogenedentota bacterium]